jgi:serine/threonine-protein kinase
MTNYPREPDEAPLFELVQLLGVGGFAQTWLARVADPELAEEYETTEVALKMPLNRQKERILRKEIELNAGLYVRLKRIGSPYLVRYLGFEIFRGSLVMVMEFVPGNTLRKRMANIPAPGRRNKPMPVDEAVQLVSGILQGLELIHQEHILHRDIKPENILMSGDVPKIADLGISRMLGSGELASTTTGTIYYMSPEILDGTASYPSDIWSVGVTLYEMVTGRLPFGDNQTPQGTLTDLIRRSEAVPPADLNPDVPSTLNDVILGALDKDPGRRPTAAAMRQQLSGLGDSAGGRVEAELAAVRAMIDASAAPREIETRLQAIIDKYPDVASGYQLLGEYRGRNARPADAIKALELGIKRCPGEAMLHWDLALAYQTDRKPVKAREALKKAMDLGLDESLRRYASRLLKVLEAP